MRVRRSTAVPAVMILVTALVIGSLAMALRGSQQEAEDQLADRFAARGELAADFAGTWIAQLLASEQRVAARLLGGDSDLSTTFTTAVSGFDFRSAALLAADGSVLAVHPVGRSTSFDLSAGDAYVATALAGRPAVSAAASRDPRGRYVVGFATPYATPTGRRVITGTYELEQTPLGDFLDAASVVPGSAVYVVDSQGLLVAGSAAAQVGPGRHRLPVELSAATQLQQRGNYDVRGDGRWFFASTGVDGTSWSVVITAPHRTLFAPVRGSGAVVPWVVLLFLALLAGGVCWTLLRLRSASHGLRTLNEALRRTARSDSLTSLPNRRRLEEVLEAVLAAAADEAPVSVLVVDVDHFKSINDTYGHATGDAVLVHLATLLRNVIRGEDVVGRWGGEEFLAILPGTDPEGAMKLAERLRLVVSKAAYVSPSGDVAVPVTVSIGCASTLTGGDKEDVLHRGDQALYRAKAAGRNQVHSDPPQPGTDDAPERRPFTVVPTPR